MTLEINHWKQNFLNLFYNCWRHLPCSIWVEIYIGNESFGTTLWSIISIISIKFHNNQMWVGNEDETKLLGKEICWSISIISKMLCNWEHCLKKSHWKWTILKRISFKYSDHLDCRFQHQVFIQEISWTMYLSKEQSSIELLRQFDRTLILDHID